MKNTIGELTNHLGNVMAVISDEASTADESNEYVSSKGIAYIDDSNHRPNDFSLIIGQIMNDFVHGTGFENLEFKCNGPISNSLRNSSVVNIALEKFREENEGNTEMKPVSYLASGFNVYWGNLQAISRNNHGILEFAVLNIETFIASAMVSIEPQKNNTEVLITIFNITSITSGDLEKHLPWNSYPKSCVRELNEETPYGNVSQTFSFTMPMNEAIGE